MAFVVVVQRAAVVPTCSGLLLWREPRSNRQELRACRWESRDVPSEEGAEWTSKAIYYGIAFFLYFSLSWYVVPTFLSSSP